MAKPINPNASVDDLLALSLAEENHAWKHPRYLAMESKITALKVKRDQIHAEIQAENARVMTYRKALRQQAEAEALVHGTDLPVEPTVSLQRLYHDHKVHVQAIELAEKQLRIIEGEISSEIVERLKPAFFRLTAAAYRRLKDLAEAKRNYLAFLRNVESGGTLVGGFPLILGRTPEEMEEEARIHGVSLDA